MAGDWKLKIGNGGLTIEFRKASVCWLPLRQFPIFNAFDPAHWEARKCH